MYSPSIGSFDLLLCLYFVDTFLKIILLVTGKINNNPIKSVAKPGKINNKDAMAKAAPDIISYIGNLLVTIWLIADFKVFNPSYLA